MATSANQLDKSGKFGDLRRRIVFLVLALVVYRIGGHIPVPGIDPSQLAHSSMDAARGGEPVSLIGIRLHILVNGDLFDAETREARPGGEAA